VNFIDNMKVLNKASALIALITIDYAVCNESGLHHLRPSAANDIETSPQGSSTEDVGRGLQSLTAMRSTVLEYWNVKRGESGIQDLSLSRVGNSEAQRMAQHMADEGKVTTKFEPAYGSTCHGTSFIMVGSYHLLNPVLDSWYDSDNGKNTANYDIVRYTGIGLVTRDRTIYMLQIFCNYKFINSITVTENGNNALRARIMRHIGNERRTRKLNPIVKSAEFQTLAERWAMEGASRGEIINHDNGVESYRRKCYGAGGEVGDYGTESGIESGIIRSIDRYLDDGGIGYTGIGIAKRNDGALFFVQVFCSLQFQKSGADVFPTASEQMIEHIVEKENDRRELVLGRSKGKLKVSSVSSVFAQEWADKIANNRVFDEDPDSGRGCGSTSYQIVAKGKKAGKIWTDIFTQVNKRELTIEYDKIKWVGTGIRKIKGSDMYVVVQNFCFWKPHVS